MALTIPKSTQSLIRRGDKSTGVWSIQRFLNRFGWPTSEDSDFGPATEINVKKMQIKLKVGADGVIGPSTMRAMTDYLCAAREKSLPDLPRKLLLSKILYESGGNPSAVNWSVAGGVDCSLTQRRVYEIDYKNDVVIKRAFDCFYQVGLSAGRLTELAEIFRPRSGVKGNAELAWRLSTLNHNYPVLADRISRVGIKGLSAYYVTPQSWVMVHRLKFPDGHPIKTPLEWGMRYSLGSSAHDEPGQACKLVTQWT